MRCVWTLSLTSLCHSVQRHRSVVDYTYTRTSYENADDPVNLHCQPAFASKANDVSDVLLLEQQWNCPKNNIITIISDDKAETRLNALLTSSGSGRWLSDSTFLILDLISQDVGGVGDDKRIEI